MTANQLQYQRNIEEERKNRRAEEQRAYEAALAQEKNKIERMKADAAIQQAVAARETAGANMENANYNFGNMVANVLKGVGSIIPF